MKVLAYIYITFVQAAFYRNTLEFNQRRARESIIYVHAVTAFHAIYASSHLPVSSKVEYT
jgi:hypothetical protein